ncbi:MAG TPA: AAA family ATPase [Gemmatimonadales bacterium]|nr:AAA family ATPase [Gemmatimonadales bacterium]
MTKPAIRSVLVGHDAALREALRRLLGGADLGVVIDLEIPERFATIGEAHLTALRQAKPDLVFLDLHEDPETGIRFAHFLADMSPDLKIVAIGPELAPDLLMAAMRAGVSDYLLRPINPEALKSSIERFSQKIGRAQNEAQRVGQILSLFSPKGGGGSTTLATNLAIVLHRLTGKKTLLVDLDLELGESALALGVQPRFSFIDFVENFRRMDASLLASYIERHDSGIHLLSAPFQPEKAETITADQVRRILGFLRQHYEYVVVDTPRSFAPSTLAAFEQSDLVFIVTTVDLPSLRNIQRGFPLLKRVLPRGVEQVRLVVNRYNANDPVTVRDVEESLGMKVFSKISNDYEAVMSSLNEGKPVVLNGKSVYAKDVKALAAQIAGLGPGKRKPGITGAVTAQFRTVLGRVGKRPGGSGND